MLHDDSLRTSAVAVRAVAGDPGASVGHLFPGKPLRSRVHVGCIQEEDRAFDAFLLVVAPLCFRMSPSRSDDVFPLKTGY